MNQDRLYFIVGGAFFVAAILNFLTGDVSIGAACTALGAAFTAVTPQGFTVRRYAAHAPRGAAA